MTGLASTYRPIGTGEVSPPPVKPDSEIGAGNLPYVRPSSSSQFPVLARKSLK